MPLDLSCVMQLLPEHVGCNQSQAGFSDPKSARTIVIMIFADDSTILDHSTRIDDAAVDAAILADRAVR